MNNFAKIWTAAISVAFMSSRVAALDLSGTDYEKIVKEFNVDPVLLYSFALIESAVVSDNGASDSP